ncbi:MAG: hypothetical protein IKD69_11015 [Solobacterium sp.]|nr:hypothetical protein [Solobacterium sp.]
MAHVWRSYLTITTMVPHEEGQESMEHQALHIIVGILMEHGMTQREALELVAALIEEEGPAIVEDLANNKDAPRIPVVLKNG